MVGVWAGNDDTTPLNGVTGGRLPARIGVMPLANVPRIEILGLFPTTQTVLAQIAAIGVLVAGFWYSGRSAAAARVPGSTAE